MSVNVFLPHDVLQLCCVPDRPYFVGQIPHAERLGYFRFIAAVKRASVNTPIHSPLLPYWLILQRLILRIVALCLQDPGCAQLAVGDPAPRGAISA